MIRYFYLFLFMHCVICGLAADDVGHNIVHINAEKKYDISKYLNHYVQGSADVSPEMAFLFFEAGKFRPVGKNNNEYINDGLVNKRSWIAIWIENTRPYESTIVFEYIFSGVNSVECFTVNDQKEIQPLIKSKAHYTTLPEGLLAKSATFNLNSQAGEKTLLLMHVVNNGQLLYVPAIIYDLDYFTKLDSSKHNFFGIFQGIFFFIIIFNLLLYLTTFDKIYLFYLLYAFFISLFALNEAGTAAYSLGLLRAVNYFSGQTFLFAGFSVWLLLMLQFLNVTKRNIGLYGSTIILAVVDLIFAFLPNIVALIGWNTKISFQEFYQSAITVLFATNLIFIAVANILRIFKGSKLAIFYAVANIPVVLGAIIYYSNYYGITDIAFGWLNPVALGLSIETFLISFGFAYRYNIINKEKQKLLIHINEQQKEITSQIIKTQELEQKRIAEDLHDELGGNLAAIKMTIQSFSMEEEKSKMLTLLIDKASTNARNIAHNLMPPEFEQTSLQGLLYNFYQRLNTEGKINFDFHASEKNGNFNKHEELVIYRIIMELTNNIIKHSQASEATVQLVYHETQLSISAEDNGIGIIYSISDGMGLKNIRSRIRYLNGSFNIDSGLNGTTIIIQIPYKKKS